MGWLELIREVGNASLIVSYMQDKITKSELAREIGNSNADLVQEYKLKKIF